MAPQHRIPDTYNRVLVLFYRLARWRSEIDIESCPDLAQRSPPRVLYMNANDSYSCNENFVSIQKLIFSLSPKTTVQFFHRLIKHSNLQVVSD